METYHWDVVGCFVWDVTATSLGRTERRRYDVTTTSCGRVGSLFLCSTNEKLFLQLLLMFKIRIRSDINPIQVEPFWDCSQMGRRFKFNNLWLALGTALKFYTRLAKGLKLKVVKFSGLIPTFVEVNISIIRNRACKYVGN